MADLIDIIRRLIDANIDLSRRICDLTVGPAGYPKPGGPAGDPAITAFEARHNIRFPPSYRAFLSVYDGVSDYIGEFALLSLGDHETGDFPDAIRQLKEFAFEAGDQSVVTGFVAGLHPDTGESVVLDTAVLDESGEMAVLYYHWEEYARYPSFRAYLEADGASLARILRKRQDRGGR